MTAAILPPVFPYCSISWPMQGAFGEYHVIRQQDRKRLIAHQIAGAPDRMPKAQRLSLARYRDAAGLRQKVAHERQFRLLVALGKAALKLVRVVEMVRNGRFVASGNKDKLFDTRGFRLFIGVNG